MSEILGENFLIFVNSFYCFSGPSTDSRCVFAVLYHFHFQSSSILPHLSCHFDWLIKYLDVSLWIDKMYYCASRRFPCNFLSQSPFRHPDDDSMMRRTMRGWKFAFAERKNEEMNSLTLMSLIVSRLIDRSFRFTLNCHFRSTVISTENQPSWKSPQSEMVT